MCACRWASPSQPLSASSLPSCTGTRGPTSRSAPRSVHLLLLLLLLLLFLLRWRHCWLSAPRSGVGEHLQRGWPASSTHQVCIPDRAHFHAHTMIGKLPGALDVRLSTPWVLHSCITQLGTPWVHPKLPFMKCPNWRSLFFQSSSCKTLWPLSSHLIV